MDQTEYRRPVNPKPPGQRRPLLPLVLLHAAAAGVCFAFFTIVPIAVCVILMVIGNDPGGPMFLPMFIIGVVLVAAIVTAFISGAALVSDLLRRRYRVPLWLPPLVVFVLATASAWLIAGDVHPAFAPVAGSVVTLMFVVHWAAISTVSFLPRLLFRAFRIDHAPPKARGDGAV